MQDIMPATAPGTCVYCPGGQPVATPSQEAVDDDNEAADPMDADDTADSNGCLSPPWPDLMIPPSDDEHTSDPVEVSQCAHCFLYI